MIKVLRYQIGDHVICNQLTGKLQFVKSLKLSNKLFGCKSFNG
ncbi:hypothetical protein [Paracerasibacillus soli]|uniref:Uncharacterized protein n=1 Tax=Paracerasibacillus soli TaxID=480284 RepID=A0ABU5CQ33_9BACI|nr:hypothetical protein [Virgibacillus soli]MDY0408486.1 hypothetical protein [Virgibacillus soli]